MAPTVPEPPAPEEPEDEDRLPGRGARYAVVAAWLLLVTSLFSPWVPWWVVSYAQDAGTTPFRVAVGVFQDVPPYAHHWATILTGILVAAAVALLFVRTAAESWRHEPPVWRRDVGISAALAAAALASAFLWPRALPRFWGRRHPEDFPGAPLSNNDTVVADFTETALPGLGWWLALAALAFLAWAWWATRAAPVQEAPTAGSTTEK